MQVHDRQNVDCNFDALSSLSPLDSLRAQVSDMNTAPRPLPLSNHQAAPPEQIQSGFQGPAFDFPTEFDFNFLSIYEALNVWVTPPNTADHTTSIWDPSSGIANASASHPSPGSTSPELSRRVQQAWPRRRARSVVLAIRNMWHVAAQHTADNVFSSTSAAGSAGSKPRWKLDDECRSRLMSECDTILLPAEKYTGPVTAPGSPRISMASEEEVHVHGLSPGTPAHTFPSTEILNMSISLYFRRFHPVLPFMHQATFDVRSTPSSLLLPMCLIGLSILNPGGAEDFIRLYLGKLLRFCRLDLTYKGLGKGGAQQLVTSLASSLLVLYLGLSCERYVDVHQAHMLAIQTLFIADRHGMFSAHVGEPITGTMYQAQGQGQDHENLWKAWARVESLKRLLVCLISIDAAYTRMLDLAANIGVERIEVVLPCESSLFEAPTAASFWRRVESGSSMIAPQLDMSRASHAAIAELDLTGIKLLLDVLALREAAARHRLLVGVSAAFEQMSFVPALAYANTDKAGNIAQALGSVSTTKMALLQQDAPTALAWHQLSLMLTADLDRIQTACGRTGQEASVAAMTDLRAWVQTASARRAVLHAAQIFSILTEHRVLDYKTLLHEPLLSNAALVAAIYVALSSSHGAESRTPPEYEAIDLLQMFDWTTVGEQGFSPHPNPDMSLASKSPQPRQFIVNGGPFTFGREDYTSGAQAARMVLLNYAQLLDEIAPPRTGSEHSHLLRTVSDFLGAIE